MDHNLHPGHSLTSYPANEVGVFSTLTNSYSLVAVGASENFYSIFEAELQDVRPICHCTIAGTRIVGRLTAGAYSNCLSRLNRVTKKYRQSKRPTRTNLHHRSRATTSPQLNTRRSQDTENRRAIISTRQCNMRKRPRGADTS